jgi:hypothetical protein
VARREVEEGGERAAKDVAARVRAAATGDSRQTALVAPSIRAEGTTVRAGGSGKAGALVFGTEFGGLGRYGWYANPRYRLSRGRQFRRPSNSYWFFRAVDKDDATHEYERAADEIVNTWGRGG